MYPYIRLAKEFLRYRSAPKLGLTDEHATDLICWPWDIDPWMELNNGRTLTLYDLGRFVLFRRIGVVDMMKRKRWSGVVAGCSVRYRRRVRSFDRFTLRTRIVGWDARFMYMEQGMWRNGECASHGLMRIAVTSKAGIVPTAECLEAMGLPQGNPPLPDWIAAWSEADALRPWPPMADTPAASTHTGLAAH
ncbi:MAG: acyl-CoA thioesterase [Pseudomonadota bacterium]